MHNRVVLEIPSLPEHVSLARLLVAQMAAQLRFTVAEVEEIKVAVSEAVTNAIVHGYQGRGDGVVRLEVSLHPGELEVEVIDQGCGMADLELARQPAYSTDPDRMGLGFIFMENFMDHLEVRSEPGRGTRVRMRKRTGTCGPVTTGGQ
ncbi:MAG: anti-sigma F factor [Firmicutes bacterium]|nr:anti-sigma F factor [Bacillota bacterium]